MKKRTFGNIVWIVAIPIFSMLVLSIISAFFEPTLMYAGLIITVLSLIVAVVFLLLLKRNITHYFSSAARTVQGSGTRTLGEFVVPIMVTNSAGEITWYNDSFRSELLLGNDVFAQPCSCIINDEAFINLKERGSTQVDYNNRKYLVFVYNFDEDMNNQHMYFFVDDTRNYKLAEDYKNSRPCIMFIHVDGLDILLKNALESQKTEIRGEIEKQIENITSTTKGYLQKISSSSYLLITDYKGFESMKQDKFSVLEKVRTLNFGERGGASLSIGAGLGKDLNQCVEFANNALDMALGRGGDQAVIKNKDEFLFFGGVTQAVQASSRVRTRVIASTLKKLIENSEDVYIMGHAYSDMDCFGSAYALCSAVQKMGKSSKVVINEETSLAKSLINLVKKDADKLSFLISPESALMHISKKSLLIIVDTHRPSVLESKALYEKANSVVVIDHHRQTVDFIDNALLFYHDPSLSSAAEMVSELLQYMGESLVSKRQAEALLAGIMLDTRNFVLKTGSRTFEALAYLRSCGADPIMVKNLFSDSLDTYTAKANIVANATFYKNYAISSCPTIMKDCRVVASQSADELLSISGVDASFVIYKTNSGVNISARSLGRINVQLIMESLGGGGHQTMAAAQLNDCDIAAANNKLIAAIDNYLLNR